MCHERVWNDAVGKLLAMKAVSYTEQCLHFCIISIEVHIFY